MSHAMEERSAEEEQISAAIREAVKGHEEIAIKLLPGLMNELVSVITPSTKSSCPVCHEGVLHHIGSRTTLQIEDYGECSQVAKILSVLKQAKEDGLLPKSVARAIGEDIPTLKQIRIKDVPLYICSNPECNVLVADPGIMRFDCGIRVEES